MQKTPSFTGVRKMQQTIVFMVEKPSLAAHLAPHIRTKFKDSKTYILSTLSAIGTFDFDYPRGLTFRDIPFLQEPKWKYPSNREFKPVQEILADDIITLELSPKDVLEIADKIVLVTDLDPANVFSFHLMISEILGHERAKDDFETIILTSLTYKFLNRAFNNPQSTKDQWYEKLVKIGSAKKYFDYNFNTNSLVIFGELLRLLGVDTNHFILSKYSLQVLFDLKIRGPIDRKNYYSLMGQWIGTGKYPASEIGSIKSRDAILDGLIKSKLLVANNAQIQISETGSIFLSLLHPDCRDVDLPLRLNEWFNNWQDSTRIKMSLYLNTFFGKQKRERFLNTRLEKLLPLMDESHLMDEGLIKSLKEMREKNPPFKAGSGSK